MKNVILAGVAVIALAGTSVVYAQHHRHEFERGGRWQRMHMSPEDRLAFADARIAAVHAGLKLTPEQEKYWPAVESAVRDFAKQRIENANARADRADAKGDSRGDAGSNALADPVAKLRDRADRMATTAAGLKRIADAADPLYKSLDDGQKRRLALLTRMGGHRFHAWRERFGFSPDRDGMDRHMDRDSNRDFDHGRRGPDRDRDDDGPSKL